MAEIVLGIGSSHGPLLSTPPEQWDLRAKADRANRSHAYRGKTYDYESLLKERAPGFATEIEPEKRRERFMQCRSALEALGRKKGRRIQARRRWPITSCGRWVTRTSISRSRTTRRAARRAAASRTPTASSTTRFCRTRRRQACRSF